MTGKRNPVCNSEAFTGDVWFVSCQGLFPIPTFTDLMQQILKTLEKVYHNPVDIEYTVNMDETGDFVSIFSSAVLSSVWSWGVSGVSVAS